MKTVKLEGLSFIDDSKQIYLCLNNAALFDSYEILGDGIDLAQAITDTSGKSYVKLYQIIEILSRAGAAVRKYLGYEESEVLTADTLMIMATPSDGLILRSTAMKAISAGFEIDIAEEEEIDTGLAELQKKTGETSRKRRSFFSWLLRRG